MSSYRLNRSDQLADVVDGLALAPRIDIWSYSTERLQVNLGGWLIEVAKHNHIRLSSAPLDMMHIFRNLLKLLSELSASLA